MKTSSRKYTYPLNIEREYVYFLKRITKELRKNTLNNLDKIYEIVLKYRKLRHDSENDEIEEEIDEDIILPILAILSAYVLKQELERLYNSVRSYITKDLEKEIHNALKKTAEETEVIARLKEAMYSLEDYKDEFIQDNEELIEKLTNDYRNKLKQTIKNSIDFGYPKAMLADEIKKNLHTIDNRAELIGVDQIGRATGRLNQYFQQKMGCNRYIWQTMLDSRVRPAHRVREGKVFEWKKPPYDGHPGMAIRCRCKAKPVFEID